MNILKLHPSGSGKVLCRILLLLCIAQSGIAQKFVQDGDAFRRKRNKFEQSEVRDTMTFSVTDPVTGKDSIIRLAKLPKPAYVNGKRIYSTPKVTAAPKPFANQQPLEHYVLDQLKPEIAKWMIKDAIFRIDIRNIVVDDEGKVIYYEYYGVHAWTGGVRRRINDGLSETINIVMTNAPAMQPAIRKGKTVNAYSDIVLEDYEVTMNSKNEVTYRNNQIGDRTGKTIELSAP
jgi:hypothetical protein